MYAKKGFTLLELLIVLAIITILLSISGFSMQGLVHNNSVDSAASKIHKSLLFARNHSASTLNNVTVCPLNNITKFCSSDWSTGVDVFIDEGVANKLDGDDVILETGQAISSSDQLKFPVNNITFTPAGQLSSLPTTPIFRYCSGDIRAGVKLSLNGRSRIVDQSAFANCN